MEGAFRLGRIGGIEISVHPTWLLSFALVTYSLAVSLFPLNYPRWGDRTYWLTAAVAALLLFVCVLLHELSHSFVARARGMPVGGITLFVFGGVTNIQGEAKRARDEFWMAFVGPLCSFVLAGAAYLGLRAVGDGPTPLAAVLDYLSYANLALAVFNLIPGFPLDGGRVLRSIIWGLTREPRLATRLAARVGQAVAYLFILGGVFLVFQGGFGTGGGGGGYPSGLVNGVWMALIGWFLFTAARASHGQASEAEDSFLMAGSLMRPPPTVLSPDLSVGDWIERHNGGAKPRTAMVGDAAGIVGLVSPSDARGLPRERWSMTPLRAVMTPTAEVVVVTPETGAEETLARLIAHNVNQLPVVHHGQLVGMVHRDDILQALEPPAPRRFPLRFLRD